LSGKGAWLWLTTLPKFQVKLNSMKDAPYIWPWNCCFLHAVHFVLKEPKNKQRRLFIMTVFHFILISLAVWRLSNLFANEDGPFDMFKRFRILCDYLCNNNKLIGLSKVNEGLQCEWCNSIWFSSVICIIYQLEMKSMTIIELFITILAVSTMVIFLKYILEAIRSQNERPEEINNN
jgi:hypothetical protein